MHIPDGIVPVSVAAGGYALAAGMTAISLRQIERKHVDPREGIPKASLLTAVFFMASLVHIPLPPTSVHLVLSGLMGVVLGWYAFPAILVGLFFQAVMFQHGGLTMLGVNACLMGIPALLSYGVFRLRNMLGETRPLPNAVLGFVAGFMAVAIGAFSAAVLLVSTVPAYLDASVERAAVTGLFVAHLPLAGIEGVFTATVVLFLLRVQPSLLKESL